MIDGIAFASKLEASVYVMLRDQVKLGLITNLELQDTVTLKEACKHCGAKSKKWKVDFSYVDSKTSEKVYVEAKGNEGAKFKQDKRLWKQNPPAKLEIWKGSAARPKLVEIIEPKGNG